MTTLNVIHVDETCNTKLSATSADVGVTIHGQSFFTGTEAFKRAAELRDLVAELEKCSITQDDVNLIAVTARSSTGLIGKSSPARHLAAYGKAMRGSESMANLNLAHTGTLSVTVMAEFIVAAFSQ